MPDFKSAAVVAARRESPWPLHTALALSLLFGALSAVYDGRIALIVALPILPVFLIMRDMRIGAVLLMFLFPFQHTPFLPQFTGFNLVNFCLFATVASLAVQQMVRATPLPPFPPQIVLAYVAPIVLAILHGLPSLHMVPRAIVVTGNIFYDSVREYLVGMLVKPLLVVLAAWLLACACRQTRRSEAFIGALMAASTLPALCIIGFVAINGFDMRILAGEHARETLGQLGMHANEFGLLLGISLSLALFVFPAIATARWRFLQGLAIAIILAGLLLTFSRGAFIGAAIAVICFALHTRKLRQIGFVLLLVLLIGALAPEAFMTRVGTGFGGEHIGNLAHSSDDPLTAGRVWIWNQVLPSFWQHPFFGSGVGSMAWSEAVVRGRIVQIHPHNLYLRIMLDMGLAGLVLLVYFVYFLMRKCGEIARDDAVPPLFRAFAVGMRVALLTVAVSGWANGKYLPDSELTLLWMGLGLLLPYMTAGKIQAVV
jgi:O-antigen ligase